MGGSNVCPQEKRFRVRATIDRVVVWPGQLKVQRCRAINGFLLTDDVKVKSRPRFLRLPLLLQDFSESQGYPSFSFNYPAFPLISLSRLDLMTPFPSGFVSH